MTGIRALARKFCQTYPRAIVRAGEVDEDLLVTWFGEVFPPSSDVVEFFPYGGDKVGMHCLICGEDLTVDVTYLNEALLAWQEHRASKVPKDHHLQAPVQIE